MTHTPTPTPTPACSGTRAGGRLGAAAALVLACAAFGQPRYDFVLIDSFNANPLAGEAYVWDINDRGVACGMATMDNVIGYPGFVWDADHGKTRIPITNPHGISNNGIVVGTGGVHDTATGQTVVPPNLPGTYYGTSFHGVNDAGIAVGTIPGCSCSDSGGVLQVPYVWDRVNGARTIQMPGAKGLLRVNNANLAIGWLNGWSNNDGFLYNLDDGWALRLGDAFPPGTGTGPTRANDINDLGVVVGTRQGTVSGVRYGYTYSTNLGAELLPFLGAGYQQALIPMGINTAGTVVGETTTTLASRRAFVYAPGEGSRDLNDPALVAGIPAGYALMSAQKVNDRGDIVGFGVTGGGKFTGFMLAARGAGCPADFNRDGFLDFFDYADFVACFEGSCPPGTDPDFNQDGFADFFDYADFVAAFELGC